MNQPEQIAGAIGEKSGIVRVRGEVIGIAFAVGLFIGFAAGGFTGWTWAKDLAFNSGYIAAQNDSLVGVVMERMSEGLKETERAAIYRSIALCDGPCPDSVGK